MSDVICNPNLFLIPGFHSTAPIRLVDGNNELEGRVEIYYSGEWGTVCHDYWDHSDATVVCRQLGYGVIRAYTNAHFGRGSGQIWLDDVGCDGAEPSLDQCDHRGWGIHNCYHSRDAGVSCIARKGYCTS